MSSELLEAEVASEYLAEAEADETGVPAGYKQTEVGVIPEDWVVSSIDECSIKVGSGKTPTGGASVYVDDGRSFIRSQNVGWGKLDLSDVAYITDAVHSTFSGTELKENDVLLNITGASIGRCSKSDKRVSGGNVNQHVCIIRTDEKKLTPKLLVELINSAIGQNQIDSYQAGGNREGLNFSQVRQLEFAIASCTEEQTAIANALSDVDALISKLEKLIAKKQAIKTATMQQLLTGRTRLPQFALHEDGSKKGYKQSELGEIPEDWEIFRFDQNFTIYAGGDVPKDSLSKLRTNECPYPIFANAIQKKGLYGYTGYKRSKPDSITITARGYLGHAEYRDEPFFPIVRLLVLEPTGALSSRYSSYAINERIEFPIESTGVPQLTAPQVGKLFIAAPSKKEQTAIATILSDMDKEIQALEQRLAKTRQIKQGMMQELLTGKTRLVKPNPSI
ncbi:restriction endonuclease subunit S [Zooshikella ganghwensis]|uniref:Restriction endonuclease subunit S n=1 Tax=Zooshikella ganghwensis TaxID=202772 RepID=A0A4P9VHZ8_9GAMM|nr:restriction endonuclease subunit S [Zooshikella ganghwensis]RDH42136.1 restriction endonuclease subunit S [Zooshikella ganghwensis]